MKRRQLTLYYRFKRAFTQFGNPKKVDFLFFQFLYKLKLLVKKPPHFVIYVALENIKLPFELRAKKVAGVKYNLPFLLTEDRTNSFAIRNLISNAKARSENFLYDKLANEVFDAYNFKGASYKNKLSLSEEVSKSRPFLKYLRKR